MKKLFYLFLLLPFTLMVSCSKDEFSPVDMNLTLSGVTQSNDSFYTVAGEDVTIDNVTVKSIDGKNSGVTNLIFYFDGVPLIGTPGNPFMGTFSTENIPAGTYTIGVTGNLLQVDSSIKDFIVEYPLTIVEKSEDLPSGAPEIGTYTQTIRINK